MLYSFSKLNSKVGSRSRMGERREGVWRIMAKRAGEASLAFIEENGRS